MEILAFTRMRTEVNTNASSIVGASVGASLAHEGRFYATHGLKARCAEGAV